MALAACGANANDGSALADGGTAGPTSGCAPLPVAPDEDVAALDEHACLHAANGPFETLDAEAAGGAAPTMPLAELRNTHVAYTVRLVGGAGALLLMPRSTATFALFHDAEDVGLRLRNEGGVEVCPAVVRPAAACSALGAVAYFSLERKAKYRVELGPTSRSEVLVVVEQVP